MPKPSFRRISILSLSLSRVLIVSPMLSRALIVSPMLSRGGKPAAQTGETKMNDKTQQAGGGSARATASIGIGLTDASAFKSSVFACAP